MEQINSQVMRHWITSKHKFGAHNVEFVETGAKSWGHGCNSCNPAAVHLLLMRGLGNPNLGLLFIHGRAHDVTALGEHHARQRSLQSHVKQRLYKAD